MMKYVEWLFVVGIGMLMYVYTDSVEFFIIYMLSCILLGVIGIDQKLVQK
jgi:hypothetical protein